MLQSLRHRPPPVIRRQSPSDRLRWWANLLESRNVADREHGWSGVWLCPEDAQAIVELMRLAAQSVEASDPAAANDGGPGWSDTIPNELDDSLRN